jgi:hypothetical protein
VFLFFSQFDYFSGALFVSVREWNYKRLFIYIYIFEISELTNHSKMRDEKAGDQGLKNRLNLSKFNGFGCDRFLKMVLFI